MTQSAFTYTYSFKDIQSKLGVVWVADHERHRQYPVQVSVDDSKLFSADYSAVSPSIADLIDLGVAVHTADRLSVRRNDRPYHIHLILPVRCPEALSSASVQEQLADVLYEYTHDHWEFTFVQRIEDGRSVEFRKPLQFPVELSTATEIALWSGGLDSLAGLCNRLTASPTTQYVLFGTGSNPYVHRVQRDVANAVKQQFSTAKLINLVQVPINLSEISGRPVNRELRARGFVFLLLGAACAYLQGQNTLFIYENGIGAINLPFRASEVGLDHARSVHPLSLLKMGRLVSTLLSTSFQFSNPFLFWTKAQMCKVFKHTSSTSLIAGTTTCDRLHRQIPMQCGCCSSCLLRRQALAVHAINDTTGYVIEGRIPRPADTLHLQAMLDQIISMRTLLNTPDPWLGLAKKYRVLWDIVDETASQENRSPEALRTQLLRLYTQYVEEWEQIQGSNGAELIRDAELQEIARWGVGRTSKGISQWTSMSLIP